ncbi:MAG: hypothetical protein ACYC3B_07725 [Sedimentisphaerales bacterium]
MKLKYIIASLLIVLSGSLSYGAIVQDLPVGYKPNSTTPNVIALTQASPTWDANIATYAEFIGGVHCILGYDSYMGGIGFADIMWNSDDTHPLHPEWGPGQFLSAPAEAPYVICGSMADGSIGFVVYKFSLPAGYITASGSVIDANVVFRGDRTQSNSQTWVGVGQTFAPSSTSFVDLANPTSYVKSYMTNEAGDGTFTQQMSLTIPAGFNEFYVVVAKDWGYANRFGFHKLRVTAVMVEGTPVIPDVDTYDEFVPGYYPNAVSPKEIALDEFNPSWDANLATVPAFAGDVHCVMGYNGTHDYADLIYRKVDGGWFDVTHQPYISCDKTPDGGKVGSFVYKFVVPGGKLTSTGGTINVGCFVRGTPSTQNWVGVSPTFAPGSSSFTEIGNMGDFTKAYMTGSVWGVYEQTLTLSIPAGLSTFYVAVVSDWGTSNYFGMYSMSVDAVLKEPSVPVMMYMMPDNRLLKYELDRMVTNDIGMSGAVLGLSQITDDVNAAGGINLVKRSYKDIVDAGENVGMRHFAVKSYMGYTTSTWPANTWATGTAWTKAIANLTATAQACNFAGIRHIIIDGERYTNLDQVTMSGTYMLEQNDSTSLNNAYLRGKDVAAAISAAAPNVDVILAPEYGSGYIGGVGSYPGWQKFRSGLLDGSTTLKVYVWVEGTYTWLTGVNDNTIELHGIGGSFTNPALYKTAVTNYLNTVSANIRSLTDSPTKWDSRGGLAPGIWVLGTANNREGKRSAWYTPELFAAQLEAYAALNVPIVLEYSPLFAWKQWFGNEVSAAGMYPYDGNPNPDNNNNWVAEVSCNPYLEAYKAVLRARGMPSPKYSFGQAGDVDGDSYVDFYDIETLALEWLNSSPMNGL